MKKIGLKFVEASTPYASPRMRVVNFAAREVLCQSGVEDLEQGDDIDF